MLNGRIVVYPAMYGHSSTNIQMQVTGNHKGCPVVDDGNYVALQVVSVLAPPPPPDAPLWNPADPWSLVIWSPAEQSPLVQIGLDWNGNPVNDQVWAKYAGHLGQLQTNSLVSGNYWAGGNLSGAEWAYLKTINFFASPILKDLTVGEGPTGPGSRYWIKPGSGQMSGNELLAVWANDNVGITSDSLARFALDLTGSGSDVVLDLWSNSKKVDATIFSPDGQSGFTRTGGMASNAPQEGYNAIAWLSAGLRSGGKEQALQLYKGGHSHLGVIVYGSDGGHDLTVLQQHDDTGQGWGFVNFSVADLRGDGTDQVVQFWDNGKVGAIVWGANGDDWFANLNAGSSNLGEGPDALAWLVADLRGDGKQEIIQLWHNKSNDHVGAVVYGSSGNQLFAKLSHQDDLGEGYGAIAWCVADINGDGRDEVVQIWNDNGKVFANVFGANGSDGLTELWRGNLDQPADTVTWQVADLDGDGRDEIVQLRNSGGNLAAIVYGGGSGNSLAVQSTNGDLYEGPNTAGNPGWLSGNFKARKAGEVVQFWDNSGSLGMIAYGTAQGAGAGAA
ncbi:FG-GAP repeat domain-containing protein [Variovorax boronicumulans]|uniref:FG-GAP repeat domain-containing protein n=1 Tax=Variovorax boronicumulans TaxID=436515 RepID=UPI003D7BCB73